MYSFAVIILSTQTPYDAEYGKKVLMPHANSEVLDERIHPCSVSGHSFSLFTYTTVSVDSVSAQQRPRSARTNVQADQGLCCLQIA